MKTAIEKLREKDEKLKIVELPIEDGEKTIFVLGIKDLDPDRNLGDYQNMTYFLLSKDNDKDVVIDPGIRQGWHIKETLGLQDCDVLFTHFHLDHWIGYEPYKGEKFYASQTTKIVLSQMVGIERTGKSLFFEGQLTDHHRRPTPVRGVNDAERLLPIKEKIFEINTEKHYVNPGLNLEFFELPYGQTEGSLYGVVNTPDNKIVFAGDLFILFKDQIKVEPHYAFKSQETVIANIIVVLKALLGEEVEDEECKEYEWLFKKIESPDKIALGHGFVDFKESRSAIEHLLRELEEYKRIEKEHII